VKFPSAKHWLRLLTLICLLPSTILAADNSAATYRDPAGRFTMTVPAGWKVRPLSDSVQIVRGDSYASVVIYPQTSDIRSLMENLQSDIGRKWHSFQAVNKGDAMLGGAHGVGASFSGTNPQGKAAVLKMIGVVSNDTAYVFITGSTKDELPKTRDALLEIERSFTLLAVKSDAANSPTGADLGLEVTDLTAEDATTYKLKQPQGALVIELADNGSAQRAGVQLHDVVIRAGGDKIDDAAALQQTIKSHKPGDELELEVLRLRSDGSVEHQTLKAVLGVSSK
jgi:hypothetical protein